MKNILLVGALALAGLSQVAYAEEHDFEITYFVMSQHIESQMDSTTEYNRNHNFIGLEYRAGKHGYALSSFKNSYYKQSYLVDYARYWKYSANIELSARIGAATGYSYGFCGKVCPFASVGISYTGSRYIIPKLSFAPAVFILSFSMRF